MKKAIITGAVLAFIGFPCCLWAQEDKKPLKETEEIIIRNNGEKDMNLKVEINGEKITVNGKPLGEFKDDKIIINKRKMIIRGDGKDDQMTIDMDGAFDLNDMVNQDKGNPRPFLGVTTEKEGEAAKITDVVKGSAAEKAGLQKDDIITKIDKDAVTSPESLANLIKDKSVDAEVKITYTRGGKTNTTKAVLGKRKENRTMIYRYNTPRKYEYRIPAPNINTYPEGNMPNWDMPAIPGIDLNDIEVNIEGMHKRPKIGLKIQDTEEGGNVKVIEVEAGSAAEKAGIKKDDLLTEINGIKVNNTDDAREQLKSDGTKNLYQVNAIRDGKPLKIDIKIPKKLKTANL
ncbi:MAG: PDZ domain-containing protein [Ferruginibacter sp.]